MTDNIKYQKAGIHFFENSIYIHDDCEENGINFFLTSQNTLLISTEYDFGCDGLSKKISIEERIKLINFLQQGLEHEINK